MLIILSASVVSQPNNIKVNSQQIDLSTSTSINALIAKTSSFPYGNNYYRGDFPKISEVIQQPRNLYPYDTFYSKGTGTRLERFWNGYIYFPTPPVNEDVKAMYWKKTINSYKDYIRNYLATQSSYTEIVPKPVNVTGNISFLAIMIEFQDVKFRSNHNSSYFGQLFNDVSQPSLKTYFLENSYGLLNITIDVYGPVTSSYNLSYYGADGSGIDDANVPIYELAREAVTLADSLVDYSKYDHNGDGYVDGVLIIHAGTGQEYSGNSTDIWSHRWSISGTVPFLDGVYVKDYDLQPEHYPPTASLPQGASILGTYCHEFGHLLGLLDFYDRDGSSEGIGYWGLMGGGSWAGVSKPGDNPAHISAWNKLYLGYKKPVELSPTITGLNSLEPVETTGNIIKLPIPGHIGEYFLLEYRSTSSGALFDKGIPGSGLLIWHIDETVAYLDWDNDGNINWIDNLVNSNESHYMVDVEEYDNYDGIQDLEYGFNDGEASDVWTNTLIGFNDLTAPSSSAYDGTPSGLRVYNISAPSTTITFNIAASIIEIRSDMRFYNTTVLLDANVSVVSGSVLEFEKSTVIFNSNKDNEFNIFVLNGSLVLNASTVYSNNPVNAFTIIAFKETNLTIIDSMIFDSDYNDINQASYSGIMASVNTTVLITNSRFYRMNQAVRIFNPRNLEIKNTTFSNNMIGLLISHSTNSLILQNKFRNNTYGLILDSSQNINVISNIFEGDNPILWGSQPTHYIHNLSNNTVNGKNLHYIQNAINTNAPNDGGPIIIVNSRNIGVSNTLITNVDAGIQIAFSHIISINNIYVNQTTIGLMTTNISAMNIDNLNIRESLTGILFANTTQTTVKNSEITRNAEAGIRVMGDATNIEIHLSNIYSNEGFGILNEAKDSINATLNWWGDPNGPEVKNVSDPTDPEEIWGNIVYNPWLTKTTTQEYLKISNITYPTRVLTNSIFNINVTTSYNFTNSTPVRVLVIDSTTNNILDLANDILVGNGTKVYRLGVTAPSYMTTMNLVVKTLYNKTWIGWVETSSISISIQVLPPHPLITITEPTNGSTILGTAITAKWTISDGCYPTAKTEIKLDNGNWIDVTGATTYTFTNVPEGTHTITVKATDTANNTAQQLVIITTIKPKPPSIKITSPTNNTITIERNITIEWNITKGYYNIVKIEIRLDNGNWTDVTGRTNYTYTNLTLGIHNVTVRVIDSAGNTARSTVIFEITIPQPPKITIITPTNGSTISTTNITVEWNVTKGYYNIVKVEIRLDNGNWIDVTGQTSYTFTNLSTGTHTITIRATDSGGKTATAKVTFEVKQQGGGGTTGGGIEIPREALYIIIGIILLAVIIIAVKRRK